MSLSLQIKQHKACHKSHADQHNLNTAASFGIAVIEKPQFGIELPVTCPFPPEQQPHEPKGKQSRHKQQPKLRVSLHPLEKAIRQAIHRLVYVRYVIRHVHEP